MKWQLFLLALIRNQLLAFRISPKSRKFSFLSSLPNDNQLIALKINAAPESSSSQKTNAVVSLKKSVKLPFWPVWSGVMAQVSEWIGLQFIADFLLTLTGGRVIPMFLAQQDNVSPFILLVHHRHSFSPFDPIRYLARFAIPEGFPSHPHAGFDTLTYCMKGGLRHRDSEGFKMSYGDGEIQWMRAGRGIMHEEMWDIPSSGFFGNKYIELFQLWVDLPSHKKNDKASLCLIKPSMMKDVHLPNANVQIKILTGNVVNPTENKNINSNVNDMGDSDDIVRGPAQEFAGSRLGIYHIFCQDHEKYLEMAINDVQTALLYIRSGSVSLSSISPSSGESSTIKARAGDIVMIKKDIRFRSSSPLLTFDVTSGPKGFDGLLLSGEDLKQPVIAEGSIVESDTDRLELSQLVFEEIGRNGFWDHRLSDEEWLEHCKKLNLNEYIKVVKSLPE